MTFSNMMLTVCTLAVCLLVMVEGHGRLWDPPARTTAWRTGRFPGAPRDYSDNELYCGGRQVQWAQNNGTCGVCGDNIKDVVKKHELGPRSLVKGIIIVGTYKSGQVIDVTVEITANHRGYFEFRLCVRDDHSTTKLTHECLDQNLLRDVSTGKTRRDIGTSTGRYVTSLQLPSGITCKECVLQWKYNTGNDWGICPDGVGRLGCSPTPEQFYGCADISITKEGDTSEGTSVNSGAGSNGKGTGGIRPAGNGNNEEDGDTTTYSPTSTITSATTSATTSTTTSTTKITTTTGSNGGARSDGNGNNDEDGDTTTSTTTSTTEATTTTGSNGNDESRSNGCRPTATYASAPGMKSWCIMNCITGFCPSSHCSDACRRIPEPVNGGVCQPTFTYRSVPGMTDWCLANCPSCPRTHCNNACREP